MKVTTRTTVLLLELSILCVENVELFDTEVPSEEANNYQTAFSTTFFIFIVIVLLYN